MGIINRTKIYQLQLLLCLTFLFMLKVSKVNSQNAGSLFMFPDNYRAQMLNPSLMRNDGAIILAVPGLAGISIDNDGNFKLTDFVYTQPSGQTVFDLGRFSNKARPINLNSVRFSLPLFYLGIPVEKGMFSIYLKEQINTAIRFPVNTITWFDNGNIPKEYRNFESGNIDFRMLSYHELGLGFTRQLSDNIHFGIRGKLLFGAVYANINNWNYTVETSPSGDQVLLTSNGTGKLSVPFPVVFDKLGQIQKIETQNIIANYFSFRNPGVTIDGGITYTIDENRTFTASVTDLGFIYFGKNAWDLYQNDSFVFRGIDISNSTNSKIGNGYVFPFNLMLNVKDSLRSVFKPFANQRHLLRGPAPKTYLHYRYRYSENLAFGVTNETVFQKLYFMNNLTVSALRWWGDFSLVGNITLHRLSSVSVGGGLQWNNSFSQLFVFTDNLMANYHPATQKSYSITFGMNFLLNHTESGIANRKNNYSRRGKISKYFPFYRRYQ